MVVACRSEIGSSSMTGDDANQVSPDRKLVPERKGWRGRLGRFFGKTNRVLSYAKGLPVITLVGSLLVGYFQYLNAYQEKVSAQAREDMAAATNTFIEIANAFSEAQTLQQILFFDFSGALDDNTEASEQALTTKDARGLFPAYEHARKTLRQNSSLLARKAEIYIDWASDFGRDAAQARTPTTDPLTQPLLGAYNFDCDWASQSDLGPQRKAKFLAEREQTRTELDNQVLRLNAFMSLAMFQMENIRVKYRPVGFVCHIPFVTPIVSLFSNYCTPVRTAPIHNR